MQRWRYDVESRQDDGATTRSRDGDLSGKEAGSGGRHEVVERGGAQPFGWLPCGFVVFVVVGVGCAVVVVGPTLRLVDLAL